VIWDVGLGAGGNTLTAIRALSELAGELHLVSFDHTVEALQFALAHAKALEFPRGFESELEGLLARGTVRFERGSLRVHWKLELGDFPKRLAGAVSGETLPPPDAIFFDAFSPKRNPEMWRHTVFENLFRCLAPERACLLATFSRSTMARVAMLLAGFYVGAGEPVAGKEETTLAGNSPELLARPLDAKWLERARVSRSAEPLHAGIYQQAPLAPETWERLCAHPQFAHLRACAKNQS
jgi:queuine tRNA-ribosyltransferase